MARLFTKKPAVAGGTADLSKLSGRWFAKGCGIVMDGSTDQTTQLQALYDSMPEHFELVIDGRVRTSKPIVLARHRGLVGLTAPRWPYQDFPISGIRPLVGFVGAAVPLAPEKTIVDATLTAMATARAADNDGWWVRDLVLDCVALPVYNAAAPIHGFFAEGLVRSANLERVTTYGARGAGFKFDKGRSTSNPRGLTGKSLVASESWGRGFDMFQTTDSHFIDLLAVGGKDDGMVYNGCTETDFFAVRSVFNTGSGHVISGSRNSGNSARFVSMSTDRNGKDGVLVTQTGTFPIAIGTLSCNRDGSSSTVLNYAALAVIGVDAANRVAPVIVESFTNTVGFDDALAGNLSPQNGIRLSFTASVRVNSGMVASVADGGQILDLGGHLRIPLLTFLHASGQFATVNRAQSRLSSLVVDVGDTTTMVLRGTSGSAKHLQFGSDETSARWKVGVVAGVETGANVGSDFEVRRFSDAGVTTGAPIRITRSNGRIVVGDTDGSQTGLDINRNSGGVVLGISSNFAGATGATGIQYSGLEATSRALTTKIAADGNSRLVIFADGRMEWGDGVAARDVFMYRSIANGLPVLKTDHAFKTGLSLTAGRPSPTTSGPGAQWYDSTLSKPIWSDGTVWRDAAGTAV